MVYSVLFSASSSCRVKSLGKTAICAKFWAHFQLPGTHPSTNQGQIQYDRLDPWCILPCHAHLVFLLLYVFMLLVCSLCTIVSFLFFFVLIIIIIIITWLITHVKSFTEWRIASAGWSWIAKVSSVVKFSLNQSFERCKAGEVWDYV